MDRTIQKKYGIQIQMNRCKNAGEHINLEACIQATTLDY